MTEMTSGGVRLIATTAAMLDAEDISGEALATLLQVHAAASWPPLHNGPETRAWLRGMMAQHPSLEGWWNWYIAADIDGTPTLVGSAGYKGPPNTAGEVEIGYSVVPAYHRRGYASAAVQLLCERALSDPTVTAVLAETLPTLIPSQGVLNKAGFAKIGSGFDADAGETWRYRLARPA